MLVAIGALTLGRWRMHVTNCEGANVGWPERSVGDGWNWRRETCEA